MVHYLRGVDSYWGPSALWIETLLASPAPTPQERKRCEQLACLQMYLYPDFFKEGQCVH